VPDEREQKDDGRQHEPFLYLMRDDRPYDRVEQYDDQNITEIASYPSVREKTDQHFNAEQ
jgi:hypothetical protein